MSSGRGMGNSQPVPIVQNQVYPGLEAHTSSPYETNCPFCKNSITTNSDKTINCCACLLCYWTGLFWYCIIQSCRGKDCCCYDATHTCPKCGKVIAKYIAC